MIALVVGEIAVTDPALGILTGTGVLVETLTEIGDLIETLIGTGDLVETLTGTGVSVETLIGLVGILIEVSPIGAGLVTEMVTDVVLDLEEMTEMIEMVDLQEEVDEMKFQLKSVSLTFFTLHYL